jgi:membrane protease YdiL (CAAX protease family)
MSNDSSKPELASSEINDPTHGERASQPPKFKVPWSPWAAVLYAVLIYFLAQIIAGSIVALYPHIKGWNSNESGNWLDNSVVAQFWYVLFAEALTFGAIWWFIRIRKTGLRSIGWRKLRLYDPIFTLVGFAVYFVGYTVLLGIATHLFPSINVTQKQQLGFQNASGGLDLFLTFVCLVVLPPLVEETVFRGFIFTGLRNSLKWGWAALITSLIFATAHLEFGSGQPLLWSAAIDTFTLSLVLCYLRQKTDSLWPGIMLHALKNCIAFIALFILHAS